VLGYHPAPLDSISYWNGIAHYLNKSPTTFTFDEFQYCLSFLQYIFPLIDTQPLATDDEIRGVLQEHAAKTSGYPANIMGCPTKGQAADKFSLDEMKYMYDTYISVIHATLKGEIRPIHKDARLFRPQDVFSYVEGTRLFMHQNNFMMDQLFISPLFIKFATPGSDIPHLYNILRAFDGDNYASDGVKWDAHYPIFCAMVICSFRSAGRDKSRVEDYYSRMYNGWTNVGGELVNLVGQPSGHVNTAIDNSLAHCVLFALHAVRHRLTLYQFIDTVKFFASGDDLIWSDRSGVFSPRLLEKTYNDMGTYSEFESYDSKPVDSLGFVGIHICEREIDGIVYKLYAYKIDKLFASIEFKIKNRTALDELAKLCSITQLLFAEKTEYQIMYTRTHKFLQSSIKHKTLNLGNPCVRGLMQSIEAWRLKRQYLGQECCP